MALISIVLPVHNAAEYLPRARDQIEALLRATTHEVEVVVVDDHSIDLSSELLSDWAVSIPGLRVIEATNRGVANARNQAVGACRGNYVWFADVDDSWAPEIVQRMADCAVATGADVVVCNAQKQFPDGSTGVIVDAPEAQLVSGLEMFTRLLSGGIQGHLWNKMFSRELLGIKPFPEARAHSDLGGLLQLSPKVKTVALLPEGLYVYEIRSGSILTSAEYRAVDLRTCLAIAKQTSTDLFAVEPPEITIFKYRNVFIPMMNDSLRRSLSARPSTGVPFERDVESSVAPAELFALIRYGHLALAVQVGLFAMPRVYKIVFRARHWLRSQKTSVARVSQPPTG